jgi:hypothetical protein
LRGPGRSSRRRRCGSRRDPSGGHRGTLSAGDVTSLRNRKPSSGRYGCAADRIHERVDLVAAFEYFERQPIGTNLPRLDEGSGITTVKVIGFDAGPKQVEDLKSGIVQGLIAQDPYTIGVDGVQQTILALKGQATTKSIRTELAAITKDNMNDAAIQKFMYKSACGS